MQLDNVWAKRAILYPVVEAGAVCDFDVRLLTAGCSFVDLLMRQVKGFLRCSQLETQSEWARSVRALPSSLRVYHTLFAQSRARPAVP
jgi:hypothetical protein